MGDTFLQTFLLCFYQEGSHKFYNESVWQRKKKPQMCFMCLCQLPLRTEASVRQNILTWASFLILLSWWKTFTYLFSSQRNFPQDLIKWNFRLVNIRLLFRYCSGLQMTLICIHEFSLCFSLSAENQPILPKTWTFSFWI